MFLFSTLPDQLLMFGEEEEDLHSVGSRKGGIKNVFSISLS